MLKMKGCVKMTEQERKVAKLLKQVGVPPHLKGYEFIKTAVLMVLEDNNILQHITKELYPEVAKKTQDNGNASRKVYPTRDRSCMRKYAV